MLSVTEIDEMYELSKSIKAQEARLADLKKKAAQDYAETGVSEMMGTKGKVIISERKNVVYDPVMMWRLCNRKMPQFLSMIRVNNTAVNTFFQPEEVEKAIQKVSTSLIISVK